MKDPVSGRCRSSLAARLLAVAAACACWGGVGIAPAQAHGRFPNAGLVVRHPTDANRLVVRSTYGLLHSDDGGGRWLWSCAAAIGWNSDTEDPVVQFTAERLLVGSFKGLAISSPDACDWRFLGGAGEGKFFRDIVLSDPTHAFAVASNGLGNDAFAVQVWQSSDAGNSWSTLGVAPPSDFLAVGISTSADGGRIYLSGRDGNSAAGYHSVLQRSDDGGQSWQRMLVPSAANDNAVSYLAAVHPTRPDVVYVANIEVLGIEVKKYQLMVSEDGGQSFTSLFQRERAVAGFALSPDGSQLALGGPEDGLFVGATSDHKLSQVNTLRVGCLSWHPEGLYACADEFKDGFALGLSQDNGATFEALMHLDSPCGVLECAASTVVGKDCPARWNVEKTELGAQDCAVAEEPASSSCRCAAVGGSCGGGGRWWLLGLGLATLMAAFRRK